MHCWLLVNLLSSLVSHSSFSQVVCTTYNVCMLVFWIYVGFFQRTKYLFVPMHTYETLTVVKSSLNGPLGTGCSLSCVTRNVCRAPLAKRFSFFGMVQRQAVAKIQRFRRCVLCSPNVSSEPFDFDEPFGITQLGYAR